MAAVSPFVVDKLLQLPPVSPTRPKTNGKFGSSSLPSSPTKLHSHSSPSYTSPSKRPTTSMNSNNNSNPFNSSSASFSSPPAGFGSTSFSSSSSPGVERCLLCGLKLLDANGNPFFFSPVNKHTMRQSQSKKFCSKSCYNIWVISKRCAECGSVNAPAFVIKPPSGFGDAKHFCSRTCYHNWECRASGSFGSGALPGETMGPLTRKPPGTAGSRAPSERPPPTADRRMHTTLEDMSTKMWMRVNPAYRTGTFQTLSSVTQSEFTPSQFQEAEKGPKIHNRKKDYFTEYTEAYLRCQAMLTSPPKKE